MEQSYLSVPWMTAAGIQLDEALPSQCVHKTDMGRLSLCCIADSRAEISQASALSSMKVNWSSIRTGGAVRTRHAARFENTARERFYCRTVFIGAAAAGPRVVRVPGAASLDSDSIRFYGLELNSNVINALVCARTVIIHSMARAALNLKPYQYTCRGIARAR